MLLVEDILCRHCFLCRITPNNSTDQRYKKPEKSMRKEEENPNQVRNGVGLYYDLGLSEPYLSILRNSGVFRS